MTILVTGGAGYVGGHVVLALLDAGERVVVLDNMLNGVAEAIRPEAPFILGDCGDGETVSRIVREYRIEAVMHFAAQLIAPQHYGDPLHYYWANAVKGHALLKVVRELGVPHFVLSSTAAVYGNPLRNPVSETAALAPVSPYGASKLMVEMMLRDLGEAGAIKFVALRYFNVAGADPLGRYGQSSTKTSLLVQIAVQAALGIRPFIEIYGDDYPTDDGTCVRDYIHVSDLVDAHLAALHHLRYGGGNLIANCGYGRGYSVKQVLDAAQSVSGRDFERRRALRRHGDAAEVVADAQLIRSVLGWKPRYDDLTTILQHALQWELRLQDTRRGRLRA